MSVWICCPSARPVEHVQKWAAAWRERGYGVAIYRDDNEALGVSDGITTFSGPGYPGYAAAVNDIIVELLSLVSCANAEWFIAAGDDVYPDPNHMAAEIAAQCADHFAIVGGTGAKRTYGVMQPTGDRYGEEVYPRVPQKSAYIDRVAGSAWIGREFARRVNQGKGPLWPEYFHMGCDEELQAVAMKLGVFWQRPDLTHRHEHWARKTGRASDAPAFLARANSTAEWQKYKKLFAEREAAGFPGSEPL